MQVKTSASQRRKLKQLHWDKIRGSQEGTIWSKTRGASPNLNFAELETLFQVGRTISVCPVLVVSSQQSFCCGILAIVFGCGAA